MNVGQSRKVLFCIYSHNVWGGIEHWLTGLARHLRAEGWKVQVGLARGRRFNDPDAFRKAYPDLPTVEFDGRTGTSEGRIRAVERVLRSLDPEVIVPVGLADAFSAAARVKASGQPLRVLAPVRATSPELMAEMANFAPAIDLCVGNNPLHERFLVGSRAFAPDRTRTIINGVSLPGHADHPGRRSDRSSLRLLFVGRLHLQHKRIRDLPVLVEELERRDVAFELTVVGDGEGKDHLLECMRSQVSSGSVRFAGFMTPDRIAREIYPVHDVLVHFSASHGEGCPQVLQQAMAHGVVPVCSEFLGIHSLGFLRDEETCRIFPVGDLARAAEHLQSVVRHPEALTSMARAGRVAMRAFDIDRVLESWQGAIRDACGLPLRDSGWELRRLAQALPGSSRLDRLGAPPGLADWLRRVSRRYPEFPDGWAEWPGTVAALDDASRSAMLAQLYSLDAASRVSQTTVGHA